MRLHFVAGVAEWLLLVAVAVLLVSTFVLSRLEASFPEATP